MHPYLYDPSTYNTYARLTQRINIAVEFEKSKNQKKSKHTHTDTHTLNVESRFAKSTQFSHFHPINTKIFIYIFLEKHFALSFVSPCILLKNFKAHLVTQNAVYEKQK